MADDTLFASQAEFDKKVAEAAAKLAEEQSKANEAAVKQTPEERAALKHERIVMEHAKIYGERIMDVLFEREEGDRHLIAITEDGLRQICIQACKGAGWSHHWARRHIENLEDQLMNASRQSGYGNRARDWSSLRNAGTRDDEPMSEFETPEARKQEHIRFYKDRCQQLEVLGMAFEYVDDECVRLRLEKDDQRRMEGHTVPDYNTNFRAIFDISEGAFVEYSTKEDRKLSEKQAEQRAVVRKSVALELRTSPIGDDDGEPDPVT